MRVNATETTGLYCPPVNLPPISIPMLSAIEIPNLFPLKYNFFFHF